MIPFLDLRPYVELIGGYDTALTRPWPYSFVLEDLLENHDFIGHGGSRVVSQLEAALAAKLKADHVIACASGTSALTLALAAHGVDRTFTVAMPNLTFWAAYETIVGLGAIPLLIDSDPDDLQMSFDEFVRAHDRYRFRAAVLPHLFGWCSTHLRNFRMFCRDRGIALIEDGAQAFGVEYKGESVFTNAETITLSFYPAKVIGGIMDGGAVLTRRARTADTVRLLANHGRTGHYEHALAGYNSRMAGVNAAWLLRAVQKSNDVIVDRLTSLYHYGNIREEGGVFTTTRGYPVAHTGSNGYLHVCTLPIPSAPFVEKLTAKGVTAARIYPKPISAQPGADHALRFGDLFNSYDFCNRVLNLPLSYGIPPQHIDTAMKALKEAL